MQIKQREIDNMAKRDKKKAMSRILALILAILMVLGVAATFIAMLVR